MSIPEDLPSILQTFRRMNKTAFLQGDSGNISVKNHFPAYLSSGNGRLPDRNLLRLHCMNRPVTGFCGCSKCHEGRVWVVPVGKVFLGCLSTQSATTVPI